MNENKRPYKVFEFFKYGIIALFPILDIYAGYAVFSLGILLLFGIMIIETLLKKGKIILNVKLFIILCILAVLNIVTYFLHMEHVDSSGYIANSIHTIIVAIICAYFVNSAIVTKEKFYKYIKVIALISSLFLCVQYFLYKNGIIVYGFLPGIDQELLGGYTYIPISYGRPNSFFLEPAHYAIYVMPVFALSLHYRKYITSLILMIGLLMSTSSTGIIGVIIVVAIVIIKEKRIPILIKWMLFFMGIAFAVLYMPAIIQSGLFDKFSFSNLKDNVRVFGTLEYFRYFGLKEIVFGVGLNQLSEFMKIYTGAAVSNYANALIFSFFSFGLAGGILWTAYVAGLHKLSKNKLLYISFIFVYISDQILFNRNLIYLLLLLYVFSDGEEESAPLNQDLVQL